MSNDDNGMLIEGSSSKELWLMQRQTKTLLQDLEEQQASFLDVAMTEARGLSGQPNTAKIVSCLIYAGSFRDLLNNIRG